MRRSFVVSIGILVFGLTLGSGCSGDKGATGAQGTPGVDGASGADGAPGADAPVLGDVAGVVTNALTGGALAGATIDVFPSATRVVTDAAGAYVLNLPTGAYELTVSRDGFAAATTRVGVMAGSSSSAATALEPLTPVLLRVPSSVEVGAADTTPVSVDVATFNGTSVATYQWDEVQGPSVTVASSTAATASVTLPGIETYKALLAAALDAPDRIMVMGIDPTTLERASTTTLKVTVTTSDGARYEASVPLRAALGLTATTGLRTVAMGTPQVVQAKASASGYAWTLSAPADSVAILDDATSRWPAFTPDVPGTYLLTETTSGASLELFADTWMGGIASLDADGRPVQDVCESCHDQTLYGDKFVGWRQSAHATTFARAIAATPANWDATCAGCHTLGADDAVDNGGFDEAAVSEGWTSPSASSADYAAMLGSGSGYEQTARMANVQCESCHGPNGTSAASAAHTAGIGPRSTYSAQLCGTCHDEAGGQDILAAWRASKHASFESAWAYGTWEGVTLNAAHCGRCHAAQGFVAWVDGGDLTVRLQGASGNATMSEILALGLTGAEAQPITCATCHDPHAAVASGPNPTGLRLFGSTGLLPAGFEADGVGAGAVCMACHNTRNGPHNDAFVPTSYAAPHFSAQADVLMGQNAYFVTTGVRSPHAYLTGSCVACHMEKDAESHNTAHERVMANHGFVASTHDCDRCHGGLSGDSVQALGDAEIARLADYIVQSVQSALASSYLWARAYDEITGLYSTSASDVVDTMIDTSTNPLVAVTLVDAHGTAALRLTFQSPVSVGWTDGTWTTPNQFVVELQSLRNGTSTVADSIALWRMDSNMMRALWNYFLLFEDKSRGVHNPGFFEDVVNATVQQSLAP